MPEQLIEPALPSAPPDKPAYRPFPELGRVIRAQADSILDEWRGRTLFSMPELAELTVTEFKNSVRRILTALADALESNDPPDLKRLMQTAPDHGFHRFMQDYELADLFAEERVLRRVIVARVEEALRRQCSAEEAAALHAMIDIMLQQGVLALVQQQKQELRQRAEAQIKHMSFLSHDLSNNFQIVANNLESIKHDLSSLPQMQGTSEVLGASLEIISRTRLGMRRLLEHERLRNADAKPDTTPVKLREIVEPLVTMAISGGGAAPAPRVDIAIDPQATAATNADLLTVILQNLIGNAVTHTSRAAESGTGASVKVEAERHRSSGPKDADAWVVSVVDNGPGIPPNQLDTLFNAFERLPQPGERPFSDESGFGLGLAIASQAARLLDTKIEVQTQVGHGSRFSIRVPAARA